MMNQSSLPPSVKGSGGASTTMSRRRQNMPQSMITNTNQILDWSQPKRGSTRGSSMSHPLNQTQLNLGSYKKSSLANQKVGAIQGILSKVPPQNGPIPGKPTSVDQKNQMSRSMNVQEILDTQMDHKQMPNSMMSSGAILIMATVRFLRSLALGIWQTEILR